MTNKIDTVLKAITDQIAGTLPSDTFKNLKLSTYLVLSAHSYLTEDPQCSTQTYGSINAITIHTKQQSASYNDREKENKEEEDDSKIIYINPPTPPDLSVTFIIEKKEDGDVMVIETVPKDDNSYKEEPEAGKQEVEYFDIFPTRSDSHITSIKWMAQSLQYFYETLSLWKDDFQTSRYHATLDMCITYDSLSNLEKEHTKSVYLRNKEDKRRGVEYVMSKILGFYKECLELGPEYVTGMDDEDPRLSQVVLGKPFVDISNMTHDPPEGVVRFTKGTDKVAYKMTQKIEQYNSLSDLEKERTKSVYLRNEEYKRKGVEYVMSKILGFYKECLELGPEYVTGMDDEGKVT
ncbi:hypothetical protein Tco_1391115, partial [Tanacetum coccineum]